MSRMNQSDPEGRLADLAQRERILAEKESILQNLQLEQQATQQLLNSDKTELRNIGTKIVVAKEQLIQLDRDKQQVIQSNQEDLVKYKAKLATIDESIHAARAAKAKVETKIKELQPVAPQLRHEVTEINEQIKERKTYLLEQEAVIDNLAKEGNKRLVDLNNGIERLKLEKEQILRDIYTLKEDRVAKEAAFVVLEHKLEFLQTKYDELAKNLRRSLTDLKAQITVTDNRYKQLLAQSEQLQTAWDIREREVSGREKALEQASKELQKRELRFKSNQAIYGL